MMPSHVALGELTIIRTGKLDANASSPDGEFPFFTCASEPLKIASFSYDCECVLVAGNGDLNVKYYSGKFDAYQRTYIIESINPERLNTRYLYHFMESHLSTLREQSIGGIIKYIKIGNLTDAKISLPPLPEQRRIAAILDKADVLRAKRREAIAKLDQLLQSVFLEMFGDPVTNPKGWPMVKLAELGEWSSGGTPPRLDATNFEGDIPWYSSGELNNVYVGKSDECISPSAIKNSAAKIMRPGSLMIGMYDTAAFKSSITTVPAACNQAIAFSYLNEEKCEPIYVYHALQLGKEHFKRMQRGVRQKNLNLSLIRDTQIAHPPLAEQREFSSRFRAIHTQIESHMMFELMANGLFASLQQQAFIAAI